MNRICSILVERLCVISQPTPNVNTNNWHNPKHGRESSRFNNFQGLLLLPWWQQELMWLAAAHHSFSFSEEEGGVNIHHGVAEERGSRCVFNSFFGL
jgi:hypothetical protein